MRTNLALITVGFLSVMTLPAVGTQEPKTKSPWDALYAKGTDLPHSEFLARMAKTRPVGRALDIGIGEGRNAFLLASLGWDVTGFDNSEVGIKVTRQAALKRGLRVTTVIGDVDEFDYGEEQWDLVAGMYMHELITRNARKIATSLKPGGMLVIEGFQFDPTKRGVGGTSYGHRPNELLRVFDQLRVIYYEEAQASPYWATSERAAPIVRFAAVRDQSR